MFGGNVCGNGIQNTRLPLARDWIYALIRKAVGAGEIGGGLGDQASDDMELGRLVEVVLGLITNGVQA